MWHVNVSTPLKVAVTKFPRANADLVFAALKELRTNPLAGKVYALGGNTYYRVVADCLIFFDLVLSQHVVNVTAVERPH